MSFAVPHSQSILRRRHLIYLSQPIGKNLGGPSGYLWHLRQGFDFLDPADMPSFAVEDEKRAAAAKTAKRAVDALRPVERFWRALKTYGPTTTRREFLHYSRLSLDNHWLPTRVEMMLESFKGVHCHTTLDGLAAHNSLRRLGLREKVQLFLTVHCPEMPGDELASHLSSNGLTRGKTRALREKLTGIDLAAIDAADVLVFPCEEALEPYFQTCSRFADTIKGKDVRYALTGVSDIDAGEPLALPVTGKGLRLAFVGRHNEVKGYDLLKQVVPDFLDSAEAWMLVAGRPEPLRPPNHLRWIELGWIPDPYGLIRAADVFVLANRQTFFDLVALEVMALGAPILASNTGGNKALARMSEGVMLFEPDEAGLRHGLSRVAALGRDALRKLGEENRRVYAAQFTAKAFAERYLSIVGARRSSQGSSALL